MKIKSDLKGILFDLDGTLLDIDLNKHFPFYHKHLYEDFPNSMTFEQFNNHMWACIFKTVTHKTGRTNYDVLMEEFLLPFSLTREEAEPILRRFYKSEYPQLKKFVNPRPESREVVQHVIKKNFKVVIATNPLFILDALKARMNWAVIDDLQFDLITHAENFTTCKPNLDYYREIKSWEKMLDRAKEILAGHSLPTHMAYMHEVVRMAVYKRQVPALYALSAIGADPVFLKAVEVLENEIYDD